MEWIIWYVYNFKNTKKKKKDFSILKTKNRIITNLKTNGIISGKLFSSPRLQINT